MKKILVPTTGLRFSTLLFIFGVVSFFGCTKSDPPVEPPVTVVINGFSPMQGIAGDEVTITGSNFGTDINAVRVKFNGLSATVKSISSTQLIVTAPANVTTGKISITINNQTVLTSSDFTAVASVTTLAGSGVFGFADGVGVNAIIADPTDLVLDQFGNMYVTANFRVRKITPDGVVTTLAGSGNNSYADGTGTAASFGAMLGIAIDRSGDLYVTDLDNACIRKITASGKVTTIAGSRIWGHVDGPTATAQFDLPMGIAIDSLGNIFVADAGNNCIRKISASGTVSTIAGNGSRGFVDGIGSAAFFYTPMKVKIDKDGNLIVADESNNSIRKVDVSGSVTTIAGNGTDGFADGEGLAAKFSAPAGVCLDKAGNIYISDQGNNRIRKISTNGNVTTVAGVATAGHLDGAATIAQFHYPNGLDIDKNGVMYLTDNFNNCIRKITP